LFSEAAVSPGGIYYRPAHLKRSFSTVTFPPGVTLLPPGAGRETLIFSALTFAACFDHNFLYRCPNELVLVALDSTLKEI